MEGLDLMTVYAVQKQMRFDQNTKELVPRFKSMDKAEKWGEITYILSSSAHPFSPDLVLGDIHEKLSTFSDDDLLLLVGNPTLIGMVTAIAGYYNDGSIRLLQWSGRHSEYTEISAKLY